MNIYEIIKIAVSRSPQLKGVAYAENQDGLERLRKAADEIYYDSKDQGKGSRFSQEDAFSAGDVGTLCGYGILYLTDKGKNRAHYLTTMVKVLHVIP